MTLTMEQATQRLLDLLDQHDGYVAIERIGERVKLYGGEMSTSAPNGGGFTLTARLPLTEYRS